MKVTDVKAVLAPGRVKAPDAAEPEATAPRDRVSVQAAKEAEAAVAAAGQTAGGRRAARLERLEAEVRSGAFHPDAGRVAAQILADAEVDARMAALMRH